MKVDCAVIGGGVVGLAVARALALRGLEVFIIEAMDRIGGGISSRNSEVIHAGLYYSTPNKTFHCLNGKSLLYSYLKANDIPHSQCGKLVLSPSSSSLPRLLSLAEKAKNNGVPVEILSGKQVREMEPNVNCDTALFSPTTGILDSHTYMQQLELDAHSHGSTTSLSTTLLSGRINPTTSHLSLSLSHHPPNNATLESFSLSPSHVINCGGLCAASIARKIEGVSPLTIPRTFFAKGNYFKYVGPSSLSSPSSASSSSLHNNEDGFGSFSGRKSIVSRLVYPLPVAGGLGVHATIDLEKSARFGPDVEWLPFSDVERDCSRIFTDDVWKVGEERRETFGKAVGEYLEGFKADYLTPDYSGIRPKLHPPSSSSFSPSSPLPESDFLIMDHSQLPSPPLPYPSPPSSSSSSSSDPPLARGAFISLFGIESPGLTSSLSLGEAVADMVAKAREGEREG